MAYKQSSPLDVEEGGVEKEAFTVYAVICSGTTSVNPFQSIASVGTLGQVLTSTGTSSLPTFQAAPTADTDVVFELVTANPSSPSDGDVWFDLTANAFEGQANSAAITFNVT